MAREQVNLRLDPELLRKVDERRGLIPRNRWIAWAVERALDDVGSAPESPAPAEQPQGLSSEQAGFVEAIERGARSAKKPKATVPPPKSTGSSPAASRGSTVPLPNRPLSRAEAFRRATQRKRSS